MLTETSPATLKEVAALAGVSQATASRAINGSDRNVKPELRDRVIAAANRLNYTANAQAQAMARGHGNIIGLVVHDIADPYFATIAAGAMKAADQFGTLVNIGSTWRKPERELDYLEYFRSQRGRGVILAGSRIDDPKLNESLKKEISLFQADGGRIVVISQQKLNVDTVVIENKNASKRLASQLIALGYRNFAILAGPQIVMTARDRTSGFKEGLKSANLKPVHVIHGNFDREGGFDAMVSLLKSKKKVDLVFAVNDVMAVGAMTAAREHGIDIGTEIGFAGFDDIETLRDVHPGLTTVRLPLFEIGSIAVNMIIDNEKSEKIKLVKIQGEVVIRESTPSRNKIKP
jgi:LacI family transcriptional regulator